MWDDKELIERVCRESFTLSQVCEKLGLSPKGSIRTLKKYIKSYKIDVSHFDAYRYKRSGGKREIPIDEILVADSKYASAWHLKNRLLKMGLLTNFCSSCGQDPLWNGKVLHLHLDHINGVGNDNRLENLRLLCPNCHSQTETYAGRNKQLMRVWRNGVSPRS